MEWSQLGKRIRDERARQWPHRADFAAVVGVSVRTLVDLERGLRSNFSPDTLAAVEAALGWVAGSCDRVRAGLEPRRWEDPMLTRLRILWPRMSSDARRIMLDLAEHAARREP